MRICARAALAGLPLTQEDIEHLHKGYVGLLSLMERIPTRWPGQPNLRTCSAPMSKRSTSDLTTLSIAEAGGLMARGEFTSTALTEAFLARIAAVDHKIASFVTLTADPARCSPRSRPIWR